MGLRRVRRQTSQALNPTPTRPGPPDHGRCDYADDCRPFTRPPSRSVEFPSGNLSFLGYHLGYQSPIFAPTPPTQESRKPAYLGAPGLMSRVGLEPTTYGLKVRSQHIRRMVLSSPKLCRVRPLGGRLFTREILRFDQFRGVWPEGCSGSSTGKDDASPTMLGMSEDFRAPTAASGPLGRDRLPLASGAKRIASESSGSRWAWAVRSRTLARSVDYETYSGARPRS